MNGDIYLIEEPFCFDVLKHFKYWLSSNSLLNYQIYFAMDCRVILKQNKMLNFLLRFEFQLLTNFTKASLFAPESYHVRVNFYEFDFLSFLHVQLFCVFYCLLFKQRYLNYILNYFKNYYVFNFCFKFVKSCIALCNAVNSDCILKRLKTFSLCFAYN